MPKCQVTCTQSVLHNILAYFQKGSPFTARLKKDYHFGTSAVLRGGASKK